MGDFEVLDMGKDTLGAMPTVNTALFHGNTSGAGEEDRDADSHHRMQEADDDIDYIGVTDQVHDIVRNAPQSVSQLAARSSFDKVVYGNDDDEFRTPGNNEVAIEEINVDDL